MQTEPWNLGEREREKLLKEAEFGERMLKQRANAAGPIL